MKIISKYLSQIINFLRFGREKKQGTVPLTWCPEHYFQMLFSSRQRTAVAVGATS